MGAVGRALAPSLAALVAVVVVLRIAYVLVAFAPPAVVPATAAAGRFSGARAHALVADMVGRCGSHPFATHANDVCAMGFLERELRAVLAVAKRYGLRAELQIQNENSSLQYQRPTITLHEYYRAMPNLAVRLYTASAESRAGGRVPRAVLFSGHFDSALDSLGASDDGIAVGVQLELLRNVIEAWHADSDGAKAWRNDMVFLFNSAEEVGLLASHAFITLHPWANDIDVVINLDAAGVTLPSLLFQVGPQNAWLLRHFETVPRPYASVFMQDVYQKLKLVPNDTDFTIYVRHGFKIGMDIAPFRGGDAYHTRQDSPESISPNTFQFVGDNHYAIAMSLLTGDLDPESPANRDSAQSDAIFTDVFGRVLVVLTDVQLDLLSTVTFTVSLAVIITVLARNGQVRRQVIYGPLVLALSVGASMAYAGVMSWINPLSWFHSPTHGMVYVFVPVIAALLLSRSLFALSPSSAVNASHMTFTALLVLCHLKGLGLTMFIAAFCIGHCVAAAAVSRLSETNGRAVAFVSAFIVPYVLSVGNLTVMFEFVTAHSDMRPGMSQDMFLMTFGGAVTSLLLLPAVTLLSDQHARRSLVRWLSVLGLVTLTFALLFPYSPDSRKRILIARQYDMRTKSSELLVAPLTSVAFGDFERAVRASGAPWAPSVQAEPAALLYKVDSVGLPYMPAPQYALRLASSPAFDVDGSLAHPFRAGSASAPSGACTLVPGAGDAAAAQRVRCVFQSPVHPLSLYLIIDGRVLWWSLPREPVANHTCHAISQHNGFSLSLAGERFEFAVLFDAPRGAPLRVLASIAYYDPELRAEYDAAVTRFLPAWCTPHTYAVGVYDETFAL